MSHRGGGSFLVPGPPRSPLRSHREARVVNGNAMLTSPRIVATQAGHAHMAPAAAVDVKSASSDGVLAAQQIQQGPSPRVPVTLTRRDAPARALSPNPMSSSGGLSQTALDNLEARIRTEQESVLAMVQRIIEQQKETLKESLSLEIKEALLLCEEQCQVLLDNINTIAVSCDERFQYINERLVHPAPTNENPPATESASLEKAAADTDVLESLRLNQARLDELEARLERNSSDILADFAQKVASTQECLATDFTNALGALEIEVSKNSQYIHKENEERVALWREMKADVNQGFEKVEVDLRTQQALLEANQLYVAGVGELSTTLEKQQQQIFSLQCSLEEFAQRLPADTTSGPDQAMEKQEPFEKSEPPSSHLEALSNEDRMDALELRVQDLRSAHEQFPEQLQASRQEGSAQLREFSGKQSARITDLSVSLIALQDMHANHYAELQAEIETRCRNHMDVEKRMQTGLAELRKLIVEQTATAASVRESSTLLSSVNPETASRLSQVVNQLRAEVENLKHGTGSRVNEEIGELRKAVDGLSVNVDAFERQQLPEKLSELVVLVDGFIGKTTDLENQELGNKFDGLQRILDGLRDKVDKLMKQQRIIDELREKSVAYEALRVPEKIGQLRTDFDELAGAVATFRELPRIVSKTNANVDDLMEKTAPLTNIDVVDLNSKYDDCAAACAERRRELEETDCRFRGAVGDLANKIEALQNLLSPEDQAAVQAADQKSSVLGEYLSSWLP